MALKKNKAGVEDINFGTGSTTQARNGRNLVITDVNASHIPYSGTENVKERIDRVDGAVADCYPLDGSRPLEANLATGGNKIVNMSDGVSDTDGATVGQVDSKLSDGFTIGNYNRRR